MIITKQYMAFWGCLCECYNTALFLCSLGVNVVFQYCACEFHPCGLLYLQLILVCVFGEHLRLGVYLPLELLTCTEWAAALFSKGFVLICNPLWSHRPFFKLKMFILL